jgi:hypothetical protein
MHRAVLVLYFVLPKRAYPAENPPPQFFIGPSMFRGFVWSLLRFFDRFRSLFTPPTARCHYSKLPKPVIVSSLGEQQDVDDYPTWVSSNVAIMYDISD